MHCLGKTGPAHPIYISSGAFRGTVTVMVGCKSLEAEGGWEACWKIYASGTIPLENTRNQLQTTRLLN